ncbi:alpha/beta fold hydrolase [Streptosporangium sp. LJ11]|uniref:alpha/beta fold hydrolase n=1 Tax=Streptosporangium sp. LJ11 TaxID=3436927 RepID=UPI003F796338
MHRQTHFREFQSLTTELESRYLSVMFPTNRNSWLFVTPTLQTRSTVPGPHRITTPTLVITGRYDVICGVRWAHELDKLIPGSELLILENSGHFGHLEEPEDFARAVAGFAASTAA